MTPATLIDLTGRRFGRWLVLCRNRGTKRGSRWWCRCDCGAEHIVRSDNLRKGKSQSCGCLALDRSRETMARIAEQCTPSSQQESA